MLMSERRKKLLHLYCSSGAIAVAMGTLISAAWANQDASAGHSSVSGAQADDAAALSVVDHASSELAAAQPGADPRQLQELAKLQHQQIVSQRRALGEIPAKIQSRAGLEFLLPSNVSGLQQLIAAQQEIIQEQGARLASGQSAAAESAPQPAADVTGFPTDLSQPLVQEPPLLAAELPEQDVTAREAFDRALQVQRGQGAEGPEVTVENITVAAASGADIPAVTEVKMAAEWQNSEASESPVKPVPVPVAANTEPVVEPAEPETGQVQGASDIETLREQLRRQSDLLERQSQQLEEQRQSVEAQKARLEELERQMADQSEVQPVTIIQSPSSGVQNAMFVTPKSLVVPGGGTYTLTQDEDAPPPVVGEEQGEQEAQRTREISGVDDAGGVLTQAGSFILEPSIQYSQSNINRFFFQGLEIVDTVLVGNIEATDSDRDSITAELQARYGFTSRLEASVSVPYVYRDDRITRQIVSANTSTTTVVDGKGLGDVEVAGRYQINRGQQGWPIFIANARFKSDTGEGPFEVSRDSNGIETELASGSGFFGFEPGMTALIRSDPVVFFINGRYFFHFGRDVDQTIGGNFIGHVDPGDVASFAVGMGFGINEEASFSLGYDHSFVFSTETEINGIAVETTDIDVGSLSLGFSYRLSPRYSVNFNVKTGVTADAPDVQMILRLPIRF